MARPIVALAGGVGAARFLSGVVRVVKADDLCVIVNTGDDRDFFGLRVCPDLDIVTYTLGGVVDRERGWGYQGDSFELLTALRKLRDDVWFNLGDRDLATHVFRTERLRAGVPLREVTAEIAARFGVDVELLPMTSSLAPTRIVKRDGSSCDFEEYLVRDGAPDTVERTDLSAAEAAEPGPGVLEAIESAEVLLVCPSNPIVSIGTILAVPGVRERVESRGDAVAVSPIIGGAPVKGPADRLLRAAGIEVSALGVAGLYRGFAKGIVIDERDAALEAPIRALGLDVRVEQTLMHDTNVAADLARAALEMARA